MENLIKSKRIECPSSRKMAFILFILSTSSFAYSQVSENTTTHKQDSLQKERLREELKSGISAFFFDHEFDGPFYLGVTNSFDLKSYALGAEFKAYTAGYIPLASISIYGNFKNVMWSFFDGTDFKSVSLGGHFAIFGLEGTMYFRESEKFFYLYPKIGFDYGSLSAFYGYGIPLSDSPFDKSYRNSISIKYFLYLNAFD